MTVDNLPLQSGQPGGQENNNQLGGGFKYFYFHPYLEKIPISTNIFQRAWNHQLEYYLINYLDVLGPGSDQWVITTIYCIYPIYK